MDEPAADPLTRAIDSVGGVSTLATLAGAKQPMVSNWRARGRVPAEWCPGIERATRQHGTVVVTCEELRPDVPWDVLRMQAA